MTNSYYYRPIAQTDAVKPDAAYALAGGQSWFSSAEKIDRTGTSALVGCTDIPPEILTRLTIPRARIGAIDVNHPVLMGILNVTPDSFSDGGKYHAHKSAIDHASAMIRNGALILDVGGESTRPGSDAVEVSQEIARTIPVIAALRAAHPGTLVSIDTRKSAVAVAAVRAGAGLINDVSALTYDMAMIECVKTSGVSVCLMHAQGDPKTMQDQPHYDNVVLDVYDYLAERVRFCEASGISRDRIIVDPGIGFGKSNNHNLALIRNLSLFHGLGCTLLLGVSRKRFIGTIGLQPDAGRRAPGSIALALEAVRQGVQILRVHDIEETRQALALWQAARQAF